MREMLFRGKRIDTGAWVQGYYFKVWDEHYICWGTTNGEVDKLLVIPETVGQDTGLKDKNGKKIFEGDILYHPIQGKRKVYYPFSERVASYGLRMIEGKVRMASTLSEGFLYEVIGNVHDNPELVEVTK